jgi:hypothetical protein
MVLAKSYRKESFAVAILDDDDYNCDDDDDDGRF